MLKLHCLAAISQPLTAQRGMVGMMHWYNAHKDRFITGALRVLELQILPLNQELGESPRSSRLLFC
jgi:hypothetical protein